jgi:tRNA splicing ligase
MGRVFEGLKAGRGRAYPLEDGKKVEKMERLRGFQWFNDLDPQEQKMKIPDFDGFLKVDEDTLSGWLAAAQMAGEPIQVRLELKKVPGENNQLKQINIDSYVSSKAGATKQKDVSSDPFDDDEIPF